MLITYIYYILVYKINGFIEPVIYIYDYAKRFTFKYYHISKCIVIMSDFCSQF